MIVKHIRTPPAAAEPVSKRDNHWDTGPREHLHMTTDPVYVLGSGITAPPGGSRLHYNRTLLTTTSQWGVMLHARA